MPRCRFLFASIIVSGFRILAYIHWTRRNRFILTAGMAIGVGSVVVPKWYAGPSIHAYTLHRY